MSDLNRRDFMKSSIFAGAVFAMATPFSRARGANDDIRVAVVGIGGKGGDHCNQWSRLQGARLVAICEALDVADKLNLNRSRNFKNIQMFVNCLKTRKLMQFQQLRPIIGIH